MLLGAAYHAILAIIFAVIAGLLMIVILLQRGRGVGLAGAFGGAGGGGSAFGAKTGDVLTWVTIVGAAILLSYTVILNYVFVPTGPDLGTPTAVAPSPGALPAPAPMTPAPSEPPPMPVAPPPAPATGPGTHLWKLDRGFQTAPGVPFGWDGAFA